jgi:hypothetical protein
MGEVKELAPHQQRVVAERDELLDRLRKLRSFITGFVYLDLDQEEQKRLAAQDMAMEKYLTILNERIGAF